MDMAMNLLIWVIFGLIAGAAAKFIMPGKDPGGIVVTILLGIAGAVVGGFIGNALGLTGVPSPDGSTVLNWQSLLIAIAGALVLLAAYRAFRMLSDTEAAPSG